MASWNQLIDWFKELELLRHAFPAFARSAWAYSFKGLARGSSRP